MKWPLLPPPLTIAVINMNDEHVFIVWIIPIQSRAKVFIPTGTASGAWSKSLAWFDGTMI